MKHVKRLIALLLLVAIVFVVVIFIMANPEPVSIQIPGLSMDELSAGAWMILSFVAGSVAGLLAGSIIIFQLRARIKLMGKKTNTRA